MQETDKHSEKSTNLLEEHNTLAIMSKQEERKQQHSGEEDKNPNYHNP